MELMAKRTKGKGTLSVGIRNQLSDCSFLNGQYTVFGQVVQGMDVINKIRLTTTTGKMPFRKDVPMKNMVIKSVTVVDQLPESI